MTLRRTVGRLVILATLTGLGFDGSCEGTPPEGDLGPPEPSYVDSEVAPEYIRTDYRATYAGRGQFERSEKTTSVVRFTIEGHPEISMYSELIPEEPPVFDGHRMYEPPFSKAWTTSVAGRVEGGVFEYQSPYGLYRNTAPPFPDIALPALASIPGGAAFELFWDGPPLGENEHVALHQGGTGAIFAETTVVGAVSITIPAEDLAGDHIELSLFRATTYPLQEGPADGSITVATYSDAVTVPVIQP